jgi:AraC-like DNA-binding protein
VNDKIINIGARGMDYNSCQGHVSGSNYYGTFQPKAPLSDWIQEFWQLNVPQGQYSYRSIPDNCVDIIINLTCPEDAVIVTPFSTTKIFEMQGPVSYFGIRFKPLGHQGLISAPMGLWNNDDNTIDAKDLLAEQLLNALYIGSDKPMSFKRRCEHYSKLLMGTLQHYSIDPRLARYINYSHKNIGLDSNLSDEQCSEFGISARQLRRLTLKHLGLSPKGFTKVLRFQTSLKMMNTSSSAWAYCYYDQPHFIKDFKSMSGLTPNEFQRLSVLYNTD